MLAFANIMRVKSVSVTMTVMFLVASLLLSAGLLIAINYGSFFEQSKEELKSSDAFYMVPDAFYTEEVRSWLNKNEHTDQVQWNEALLLNSEILYQGEERNLKVLFLNLEDHREISKVKYYDADALSDKMSVYVPDIFKAVGGYQLNDKITLTYTGFDNIETTLTFVVKGYTEDIFFSSTTIGLLGFYMNGDTYALVADALDNPAYKMHIAFVNLDSIASASKIESGIRELINLNTVSTFMVLDNSEMLVAMDIDFVEMGRCLIPSVVAVIMVFFALVIVVVCLLVVRFRIVNSIAEDMVNIGSLKSVGYDSQQVILSFLIQFGSIASLGCLIGILLSYSILPYVSLVFEKQSGLRWEQGFDGYISGAVFTAILSIVVTVTIHAARPVRQLSPVKAFRGETESRVHKQDRFYLSSIPVSLPAAMAIKSVLQGSKQSLMILFVVTAVAFLGAYGIIVYYNTTIDTKAFYEIPGMEICNAVATLDPRKDHRPFIEEIENMANVRKVQYVDEVKLRVDGYEATSDIMSDYSGKENIAVYKGHYPQNSGEITLSGLLAERLNKHVGEWVTVQLGGNEKNFHITGLSSGIANGGITTCLLLEDFKLLDPGFHPQSLYIYLDKGTNVPEFLKTLESRFDKGLLKTTFDFDKYMHDEMLSFKDIASALGLVMLIITLVVIVLVMYFIISSSVISKKRELGVQKAIGFSTPQLMNQIALCFAIPMMPGIIAGCLLGVYYTNPMISVLMRSAGIMRTNYIINSLWVAVFGIGVFIFAYFLSLAVTWRIRKISAYALVTE